MKIAVGFDFSEQELETVKSFYGFFPDEQTLDLFVRTFINQALHTLREQEDDNFKITDTTERE